MTEDWNDLVRHEEERVLAEKSHLENERAALEAQHLQFLQGLRQQGINKAKGIQEIALPLLDKFGIRRKLESMREQCWLLGYVVPHSFDYHATKLSDKDNNPTFINGYKLVYQYPFSVKVGRHISSREFDDRWENVGYRVVQARTELAVTTDGNQFFVASYYQIGDIVPNRGLLIIPLFRDKDFPHSVTRKIPIDEQTDQNLNSVLAEDILNRRELHALPSELEALGRPLTDVYERQLHPRKKPGFLDWFRPH